MKNHSKPPRNSPLYFDVIPLCTPEEAGGLSRAANRRRGLGIAVTLDDSTKPRYRVFKASDWQELVALIESQPLVVGYNCRGFDLEILRGMGRVRPRKICDVQECGAEQIVFLGDIVGYGASPAECVALVRQLGGNCVMGNHDVEIRSVRKRGCTFHDPDWKNSGYLAGLAHAAKCLDAEQAKWLENLPYGMRIPGAMVAHASLVEPEAFDYIEDAESAEPTLAILRKENC